MFTPYRYGGRTKMGIDCSALIKNIFSHYKISLPRISYHQSKIGFFIPKNKIEKGDLLFFSTRTRSISNKINHVGLVIGVNYNQIFFIHASTSHGVIISHLHQKYWDKRFVMARRILFISHNNQPKIPMISNRSRN
ncbi:C40 family peptidase [Blattabacterium cuenoti]|uniref:C40 family peptidase n=1 Tax=Blattabacterium cuenoti TaxID=1653831 RepID=UPI00163BC958|nr:C40 family peptidase [Blattabacterium cuenoti]